MNRIGRRNPPARPRSSAWRQEPAAGGFSAVVSLLDRQLMILHEMVEFFAAGNFLLAGIAIGYYSKV